MVRLGQAEAADVLAAGQLGQVLLLGGFVAEFVDGYHHQRGLHAHHRAVAGIDALHFAGDQAVADVIQAAAAVGFGNGRTEQAGFAHFAEDSGIRLFIAKGVQHARKQLVLRVGMRRIANHSLLIGKLSVKKERVFPVECRCRHI